MKPAQPRFTSDDAERASAEWGANCGPAAVAAVLGLTLDEVRPHLGSFESKRYTNPGLMFATLDRLGARWSRQRRAPLRWPDYGLARIQWHGPWTRPGVPPRAAYRHTHWVGAVRAEYGRIGVFDINALGNGSGWCDLSDWAALVVPHILEHCEPRANGRWSLTHVLEIDRS